MGNETVKVTKVELQTTDFAKDAKAKKQTFQIGQANELLKLPNSKWELADKAFKFNGKEIVKA